ncbi:hypothetical protein FQA39_LY09519 [Lamprigera yunnana]|nr:hypothetical protein FQA39_LY09519 [Lamprigera yunnana]
MIDYEKEFNSIEKCEILNVVKAEEVIDAVIVLPEVEQFINEEEIEHGRMNIDDRGDELPVSVVGIFAIRAILHAKTDISVPETIQNTSQESKQKKKKLTTKCLEVCPQLILKLLKTVKLGVSKK